MNPPCSHGSPSISSFSAVATSAWNLAISPLRQPRHRSSHRQTIISREDPETAAELQRALEAEEFIPAQHRTLRAESKDSAVTLSFESPAAHRPSRLALLVATGRRQTPTISVSTRPDRTDKTGYIKVNGRWRKRSRHLGPGDCKAAGIHAYFLQRFSDCLRQFGGRKISRLKMARPSCVFTDPQLGGVGMTEKEARAKARIKNRPMPMTNVARAIERGETAGS